MTKVSPSSFSQVPLIEKENLESVTFCDKDKMTSQQERHLRSEKLHKAMVLGNTYKEKVTIIFETAEGLSKVFTTVWAVTDSYTLLKEGIYIPVACIRDILFHH